MDTTFSAPPPGRAAACRAEIGPARPTAPAEPQGARLQARHGAAGRRPRGRGAGDRRRARRRTLALGLPRLASLTYFFVCEALWGQTLGKRLLGLRVLMRDGRPATASAVSARTVLRLIEDGPLGLVVMLLSGRRRQRLGDLLGSTIVARATPGLPHAPLSPLMIL